MRNNFEQWHVKRELEQLLKLTFWNKHCSTSWQENEAIDESTDAELYVVLVRQYKKLIVRHHKYV